MTSHNCMPSNAQLGLPRDKNNKTSSKYVLKIIQLRLTLCH